MGSKVAMIFVGVLYVFRVCCVSLGGENKKIVFTLQDASQRDIYPSTHHHAATLLHDDDALLGDSQV